MVIESPEEVNYTFTFYNVKRFDKLTESSNKVTNLLKYDHMYVTFNTADFLRKSALGMVTTITISLSKADQRSASVKETRIRRMRYL